MKTTRASDGANRSDVTQTIRRRGLVAAAWAAVLGYVLKWTTQPVQAAASLQFQDVASGFEQNDAHGPTTILSAAADYFNTFPVFTGLAFQGPAMAGIAGGSSTVFTTPSMRCGVHGYQSKVASPSAGVLGEDRAGTGAGVVGRSGSNGLGNSVGVQGEAGGGIGVRGLIAATSTANAIAVYGLNSSSYAGPGPGAGGFGVYGLSANGHGLVGATATAGGAAVVGATNGVAGAFAGAFYGPVVVSGALTVIGAKSAAVPHPDGAHRLLYCVESPESWFEDFGQGQLECGRADVTIDPDFAALVDLNDYHVFLTELGDHHALSVRSRTPSGFSVEADLAVAALKGQRDADLVGTFCWRVVARRKDIVATRLAAFAPLPEPELPTPPSSEGSESIEAVSISPSAARRW
jgi:hypothetical protein